MTVHHIDRAEPAPPTPEEARERLVIVLDHTLDTLVALLGPNATQALVAGRVLRAQLKFRGEPK